MGAFSAPRDWGRLLTAMVTPFRADGSLNLQEAARIAGYLVDEQANDGLVVSGTTGESPTLTHSEKLDLLRVVLDAVGDRAAVLFGAGTYNTQESIELARQAEAVGAHGVMLVSPYYSKPGQEGLRAHFEAIAGAVSLPIMLYNIQGRTSINLETPTLLSLAQTPNIVAVKEASGNMGQICDVCAQAPDGFRVYSGDDAITLPVMSVGGHGVVSVAAHLVGSQMKAMIEAFPGDLEQAIAIQRQIAPVISAIFRFPNPVPVKYALSLRGFDCEGVRLPLTRLTDEQKAVIQKACGTTG